MQTIQPLISVGTLCYNTGQYVIESLACLKRQNYPNIQHIIIDDASQDNSVELIENWIKENNHQCTFIKREKNKGVHAGLVEFMALVKGKYFILISDDLWPDNKLTEMVRIFETLDESYAMVYGDTKMIDQYGKILVKSMYKNYRGDNFVPPSGDIFCEVVNDFYFFIQASLIRTSSFMQLNYQFDKSIISEDWDWQLALSREFKILGLKEVYAYYRWLNSSIGRTLWTEEKITKVWLSQIKMFLKYYNHSKNKDKDKVVIYRKIWQLYENLLKKPQFSSKDNIELLLNIFKITHKVHLLSRACAVLTGAVVRKCLDFLYKLTQPRTYDTLDNNTALTSPDRKGFDWFKDFNFATVIDIGANEGQFVEKIFPIMPKATFHCFEPLKDVYHNLTQIFECINNIKTYNCGLGTENTSIEIEKNEYSPSSSILPMLDLHKNNFDYAIATTLETITIRKLDDMFLEAIPRPLLVKVDVQGYEKQVIEGGHKVFAQADVVIIETSFYPLYVNQPLFNEIYDYFTANGFQYMGNIEQLLAPTDHKILQADAIFIRK